MARKDPLHFIWFICQGVAFIGAAGFILRPTSFLYRQQLIATISAYVIVVYKETMSRSKRGRETGLRDVLATENTQYLLVNTGLLFSGQYYLAMHINMIYPIFHVVTYVRGVIMDGLLGDPKSPILKDVAYAIEKGVKSSYDGAMNVAAVLEFVLWAHIYTKTLFRMENQWLLCCLYSTFIRARLANSPSSKQVLAYAADTIDKLVQLDMMPSAVKRGWESLNEIMGQVMIVTDLASYPTELQQYTATGKPKDE
ncbi:hypothetical protein F4677DRAFT_407217 [Hypoxylon crocopeplum]|nr:hypothetical protein F4677DRAFT_407217 [Hypoxylon crocopeplum]